MSAILSTKLKKKNCQFLKKNFKSCKNNIN